eukprot:CAMPEP_0170499836 /NCGR_PEP_ID=MMETSP0208-20121228/32797_1 /TAXON_ID=197538 /ORGANISM="Strombidium inclinatum, Strain S3" /LENGTH=77 /DNA_ID=CAMNT_0010777573 /DNA_START=402 /DNA_END=635 /DNA_ORIENTATION=-
MVIDSQLKYGFSRQLIAIVLTTDEGLKNKYGEWKDVDDRRKREILKMEESEKPKDLVTNEDGKMRELNFIMDKKQYR